ncbi:MAG: protein NLRC3-like [Rickettsiaceae bacterium]|jgi:hypothetical protein|nr:protein NLRC3-like [Rickettsiaceae bacterium]
MKRKEDIIDKIIAGKDGFSPLTEDEELNEQISICLSGLSEEILTQRQEDLHYVLRLASQAMAYAEDNVTKRKLIEAAISIVSTDSQLLMVLKNEWVTSLQPHRDLQQSNHQPLNIDYRIDHNDRNMKRLFRLVQPLKHGYKPHSNNEDLVILAEALKTNNSLYTLNLDSNNIDDKTAAIIAKSLEENTTLLSLSLTNNNIKDEGAIALAKMLKINSTLISLYLNKNQIGNLGAAAIEEALEINRGLKIIELQENNIDPSSAEKFTKIKSISDPELSFGINLKLSDEQKSDADTPGTTPESPSGSKIHEEKDRGVSRKLW